MTRENDYHHRTWPQERWISIAPRFRPDHAEPAPIPRALHNEIVRRETARGWSQGFMAGAVVGAVALAVGAALAGVGA
jgi:hypothetical protein